LKFFVAKNDSVFIKISKSLSLREVHFQTLLGLKFINVEGNKST
jgi:hypothetical protein